MGKLSGKSLNRINHYKVVLWRSGILLCLFSACHQSSPRNTAKVEYTIDTSKITVIPFDTSDHIFTKDCKATNISASEIHKGEIILADCINSWNNKINESNKKHVDKQEDFNDYSVDLKKYKRQYLAVLNANGEKEVWINCFYTDYSNFSWKKNIVSVLDGGKCFFNVRVNLTTGEYYDFEMNGNA